MILVQPLDPKYFRAFKAVDRSCSFSEAADIAAMTQANVSKHIKALEDSIGSDLFLRTPKGPVITEAGIKLRDYIRDFENLHADFLLDVGSGSGDVKINLFRYKAKIDTPGQQAFKDLVGRGQLEIKCQCRMFFTAIEQHGKMRR